MTSRIESGIVILPEHLIKGLGIGRDRCNVLIHTKPDGYVLAECRSKKTLSGCRADYQHRGHTITGCPLRDTSADNQHAVWTAETNLGLEFKVV